MLEYTYTLFFSTNCMGFTARWCQVTKEVHTLSIKICVELHIQVNSLFLNNCKIIYVVHL